MSADALARGARGGSVIIVGQFTKLAIQVLGLMVLSRLLAPEDFGLVAMVSVFLSLGSLLRDFGMPTAALQARTLTDQQASNFFWASATLGAGAAGLLAALGPVLGSIYDEPRLALIAPLMASTLLLNGLQAQIQVQLARSLRFTALAVTDVTAQALGLIAAVTTALAGWGFWAIVAQAVVAAMALLISRAAIAAWTPKRPRRGHGSAALFRSGWDIGLAQMLAFAANNVDTFVIGIRWGPTQLGYYNRAFQLYSIPRSGMLDPLAQVVVPTLNTATAGTNQNASGLFLRIQFAISAAVTLVYLVGATTADWLIPMLLGDQWRQAVVPFQILAIGGFFAAFGSVSYWVFLHEQKSRHLLYLHLVTKPIMIALVLIGLPFGIAGVALGYAVAQAVAWPINLAWLARVAGQDSWAFLRVGLRTILAGGVAFLATRGALALIDQSGNVIPTVAGGAIATAVYLGVLVVTPGGLRQISGAIRVARALLRR